MFIEVKLNPFYRVNEIGEMERTDGLPFDLPEEGNMVYISLDGLDSSWFDKMWLYWMSLYKVVFPTHLRSRYLNINFQRIDISVGTKPREYLSGMMMTFKSPIHLSKEFRIVPNVTDLSVNDYGVVKETLTGVIKTIRISNGYSTVNHNNETYMVHRLVAHAWLPNLYPEQKTIINHKNAKKQDNRVANLEWCDYEENARHAARLGLIKGSVCGSVRDFVTGEITRYNTVSKINRLLDKADNYPILNYLLRNESHLYKDRYEVRINGDDRPWYYENKSEVDKNGKYEITVIEDDEIAKVFRDTRDLADAYNVPSKGRSVWKIVEEIKQNFPKYSIDVKQIGKLIQPVEVYNVKDGTVVEFASMREAARELNVHYSTINNHVSKGKNSVYKGYVFRNKSNEPFIVDFELPASYKILVTNVDTKETKEYNSQRELAKIFGVDRSVIKMRLKTGKLLNGYKFEYIASPYE